jgi:serine/threonine protein kinase
MSGRTRPDGAELPLELLDRIDRICDRFEAVWEKGERPRVEDYLDGIEAPYRPALVRDLLAAEIDARRRRGERPTAAEYAARCPEHAAWICGLFPGPERIEPLGTRPVERAGLSDETRADECPSRLGDYRIERELGRGGMGFVYRAFDEKRGAVVALKTMQRADPAAVLRFKQEFRALADLSHPNLVSLYELAADGPSWFFTMELVEGVDLLTFVRSGADGPVPETVEDPALSGPPSPAAPIPTTELLGDGEPADPEPGSERVRAGPLEMPPRSVGKSAAALARLRAVLRQLAEGVAVLHEAGKLHRDLKPSNVLVTGQGRVVILDFGLAAELGPSGLYQSSAHQVLGTVSYMAPEQAAGLPVSPASDWYSVGSMLYELLTGRPPFLGRPLEVLMDKQRFEPPAPSELAPGLSEDLNALCVDLLRRDPEARPTGRDVLRRLGRVSGEPEIPIPLQPSPSRLAPLVGRDQPLECLEAAFAEMCRGRAVACYVHGPSGIGKTALVRRFLDARIGHDDAIVLAGRCYEQESVPYKALDSVVDALSRYLKHLPLLEAQALLPRDIRSLVRVFPALRQAEAVATAPRLAADIPDPQELRRRAFGALRELLARLGDRRPVVMAIDDLQWGDSDSAALLTELLRPLDPPRFLLLGCYRSEDAATSPLLRALLESGGGNGPAIDPRVLALGTLESADAEGLALTLLGREDPAARAHASAIARESGGNPFFVTELVRHLQADIGLLDRVPEAHEVALDEVLWSRIGRLPEEARRLLEIVAVAGRPLGQAEACRAAELGAGERTAPALLRSSRLIRSAGPADRDEIETYHDRVREAVVAHLPPHTWEAHHRRLALVLEPSGRVDPEVLAIHFFQGGRDCERAGTYFARAAARAAEALAFDRAAKLYRLGLEIRPGDDAEARRLRMGIGDALANAGRGAEAAREYLAAAAGATVAEALERRRLAAMQYLISGHVDEGLAELSAVLKAVGMAMPSTPRRALLSAIMRRLRLRLRGLHFRPRDTSQVSAEDLTRIDVCWTAAGGLGITDPIRGADFQARGLLLALRAGEPYRIARGLALEAAYVSIAGGSSERRVSRLLRAAGEIARRLDDPHSTGLVIAARGIAAYFRGEWKQGGELCDRAAALLRTHCTGVTWEVDRTVLFSLWSLQFRGELAELGRRWPVVLKEARERGDRYLMTNLNTFLISTLRLAADDPEGAEAELRQVMGQWSRQGFHVQHNEGFGAEVQIRLYRGDRAGAWDFIATRYAPSLARSYLKRLQKIRIFLYERRARCALAAAVQAAHPGPLLDAAKRDARRLQREGMAWSRALSMPILAGIAAARGDTSKAAELLAAAVTCLEAVDMHLYAAASRRRLGELRGGDEGRALVEQADSWMTQQGIEKPSRMAEVFAPDVTRRVAVERRRPHPAAVRRRVP